MRPRLPTEEEKSELLKLGVVLGYILDRVGNSEEATSEEAMRDLIDHAAIAVFDDYTYMYEDNAERREFKKLFVVVFANDPYAPKILDAIANVV